MSCWFLILNDQRLQSLRSHGESTGVNNHVEPDNVTITSGASPTQNRLEMELKKKNFRHFRFVRAPPDYYDQVRPCLLHLMCVLLNSHESVHTHLSQVSHLLRFFNWLQPLEYRMGCVGAASVNHLCKSMIMENTRAHPTVDSWLNPQNSKYYVVIVQVRACVSCSSKMLLFFINFATLCLQQCESVSALFLRLKIIVFFANFVAWCPPWSWIVCEI
jgi:hypothetical protein